MRKKLTTNTFLYFLITLNTLKTGKIGANMINGSTPFLKLRSVCFYFSCVLFILAHSISCYQCSGTDSNEPFECNEFLDSNSQVVPTDCEGIHDAKFCIKHVGRFEGTE